MFDYGSQAANQKAYNQSTAPLYNLSSVKLPVALFFAKNDWLADTVDVKYLQANLPNIVYSRLIDDWNHLDFVWAMNAPTVIYGDIIKLMRNYS